jgi:hypothetical protein
VQLRPDRIELIEGATRLLTFDLSPAIRGGSITGTPTIEAPGLTFTTPSVSGTTVTTLVSGGTAGKDDIAKITVSFNSGETDVAALLIEWKAPGYDFRAGRR